MSFNAFNFPLMVAQGGKNGDAPRQMSVTVGQGQSEWVQFVDNVVTKCIGLIGCLKVR